VKNNKRKSTKWIINITLGFFCLLWIIPTLGLFVSSFRPAEDILTNGWWTLVPHKQWATVQELTLPRTTDLSKPIDVMGEKFSSEQLSNGVKDAKGDRLIWQDPFSRLLNVQHKKWKFGSQVTIDNYKNVLNGKQYKLTMPDGSVQTQKGENLSRAFLNTFTVAVPSTLIPLIIASFAAFAFSWLKFPFRKTLFVIIISLLVVPLQVALIPIMKDYTTLGLFESAYMDGATNYTIFTRLVLPLSVPAIASIGIFQFLWVWNDYLISLIFIGSQPNVQVLSMRIANMVGTRGNDWHLLTSAAFVSMILPLCVFFALQKYFVRGLLGGSVKG
jgi:alpha-glucoside transport system permease protein